MKDFVMFVSFVRHAAFKFFKFCSLFGKLEAEA